MRSNQRLSLLLALLLSVFVPLHCSLSPPSPVASLQQMPFQSRAVFGPRASSLFVANVLPELQMVEPFPFDPTGDYAQQMKNAWGSAGEQQPMARILPTEVKRQMIAKRGSLGPRPLRFGRR